jgi:hypothetical protein
MIDTNDCETIAKTCEDLKDTVCNTAEKEMEKCENFAEQECREVTENVCDEVSEPKCLTVFETVCRKEVIEECSIAGQQVSKFCILQ